MKKVLVIAAVTLVFTLSSVAQTEHKGHAAKKSAGTAEGAKSSQLTGCLGAQNSEGAYVLTNGRYKKGVEVGGNDDLKSHVGHTVKLTGTWAKSGAEIGEKENEAAEKNEKKEKGEKAEAAERHFKVASIAMVADTCKAPAAGAAAGGAKKDKKSSSKPSGT